MNVEGRLLITLQVALSEEEAIQFRRLMIDPTSTPTFDTPALQTIRNDIRDTLGTLLRIHE